MDVVAVCRSQRRMRTKVARILDAYLFRIGDRTWRGRASMECLRRISAELKEGASRHMAVAVYRGGSREEHQRPLFLVGSKARFSSDGRCPISVRSSAKLRERSSEEAFLKSFVEIAALFHDAGKATVMFQEKIHAAADGRSTKPDPVRHEVFSAIMLSELLQSAEGAGEIAKELIKASEDPLSMRKAAERAAARVADLHARQSASCEILTRSEIGTPMGLKAQLLLLVLSHHRLPDIEHTRGQVRSKNHVLFQIGMKPGLSAVAEGTPFWEEEWFLRRLANAATVLLDGGHSGEMPALDVYGRLALMMADHIGSWEKATGAPSDHLANTGKDGGPGDSLSKHVQRVVGASRPMVAGLMRQLDGFPSIAIDDVPSEIGAATYSGSRFDWQVAAAEKAGRIAQECGGGFFGAVISGTGSGKTRGAAMMMAATSAAGDGPGAGVRYNLALPLRTLARQSGQEYVEDLGFRPEDVATFVGGVVPEWEEDFGQTPGAQRVIETGSEDRLLSMISAEVEDYTDDDLSLSFSGLGGEGDRVLPAFAARLCMAGGGGRHAMEKLLKTPVVAATIDHIMPAASPLKGAHLPAMLRTMSADLVIDELDQFGDEDLSAVRRLVRLAGLAGRRVLVMSATLPREVVEVFFATYREAYSSFAKIHQRADRVGFLCAGDAPGATFGSDSTGTVVEAFDVCASVLRRYCAEGPVVQMAEVMPRADDWQHQVQIVSEKMDELHASHSAQIGDFQVSAGLVRLTRIKHLQALAAALSKEASGSVHREYVVLHSALPRAQREIIERSLKRALTRKGSEADEGLRQMLSTHGVFERAARAGCREIGLVVLASPVIETGNDVDFDWMITDPSSVRAIVQASGRVNRHRRIPVGVPNIAILGAPLIAWETGAMQKPGPETKPNPETGVKAVSLDVDRRTDLLLAQRGAFPMSPFLAVDGASPLAAAESDLRSRYSEVASRDMAVGLFFWSSLSATKHRFRRPDGKYLELFPVVQGRGLSWVYYASWKLVVQHSLRSGSSVVSGNFLFADRGLRETLELMKGFKEGKPALGSMLSVRDRLSGTADVLDPILGILPEGRLREPVPHVASS